MIAAEPRSFQIPLIEFVESDDLYLQQQEDVVWFSVVRNLDWRSFRQVAAWYYQALWQFNVRQAQMAREQSVTHAANPETKSDATLRLLFERATMCEDTPALHELPASVPAQIQVDPQRLRPGTPPPRLAGRTPKCFFALLAAFLGTMFRNRPAEPEIVNAELRDNPSFSRACGFTLPRPGRYSYTDVPSLRKLQQFDQIMTEAGLWSQAKIHQVRQNFQTGRIHAEPTLVHDTTHYPAYSSMRTVEIPSSTPPAVSAEPEATAVATADSPTESPADTPKTKVKKAAKPRRKSHPKTTKRCRCEDRQHCPHPWVNADDGAGTVVKSTGKMYWAHKASTLCFPGQQVLLDAVAMSDAASHDSQSLVPHLKGLFQAYPDLKPAVHRVLDDGAADDPTLKETVQLDLGIELCAPINPRNRKPIRNELPRGMDHVTPTGTPVCRAAYPFDFVGCRHDTNRFLFRAPEDAQGVPVCQGCLLRPECYRGTDGARQITVPFERLPWIDPKFPQISRRFARVMANRTAIERLHKLMKYDYGDEQLTKRGNPAFQARLDKTVLAMHVMLAQS